MWVVVVVGLLALLFGIGLGVWAVARLAVRLTVQPTRMLGFINLIKAQQSAVVCDRIITECSRITWANLSNYDKVVSVINDVKAELSRHDKQDKNS